MNRSITIAMLFALIAASGLYSSDSEAQPVTEDDKYKSEVLISFGENGNFEVFHSAYIPDNKRLSKSEVQSKIKEHRATFSVKKLANLDSAGMPIADKKFFDNSIKQVVNLISDYVRKNPTSFQVKPTGERILSEDYGELQGYMFCASYLHEKTEVSCAALTLLASDLETITSRLEQAGVAYSNPA